MNKTKLNAIGPRGLFMLLTPIVAIVIALPALAGIAPSPFKGEKAAQTGQNPQSPQDQMGIAIEDRAPLIKSDIASMKGEIKGALNGIERADQGKNLQTILLSRSIASMRNLISTLLKNAAGDQNMSEMIRGLGRRLDRLEGARNANDRSASRAALSEMSAELSKIESNVKAAGK